MRYTKLIVVLFILSFAQSAFSEGTISAKDFWQEFQNDKQKADAKYIGQTLNYTGIVTGTGISIYMTPNVMLSDSADGQNYLICVLPRADVNKLTDFNKGDTVTMTGRVNSSKAGGGVVIKECKQVLD